MFSTRILRSTANIALQHAAKPAAKSTGRVGRRVGEAWAITEAKRLVPTLFMYGGFMAAVLGWPYYIRLFDLGIGINGLEADKV